MKKSERTEKINVRIIKKPSKKRTEFQKIEPKKENKKNHYSKEAKKNKTKITLIITAIMIVIFFTWLSLLDKSFSRIDNEEPSFLQRIITDLKDEFSAITNSFEKAKSTLSNESDLSEETELEKDIFPETK